MWLVHSCTRHVRRTVAYTARTETRLLRPVEAGRCRPSRDDGQHQLPVGLAMSEGITIGAALTIGCCTLLCSARSGKTIQATAYQSDGQRDDKGPFGRVPGGERRGLSGTLWHACRDRSDAHRRILGTENGGSSNRG